MDVLVTVRNRNDGSRRQLTVNVASCDTVRAVSDKISAITKIPVDKLKIVLCGRVLEASTPVSSLLLGPTTSILALVVETDPLSPTNSLVPSAEPSTTGAAASLVASLIPPSLIKPNPNTPQIGSFHVFCKQCKDVQKGKLRIRCSECKSSEVIVRSEPNCWADVLKSRRISVDCEGCSHPSATAHFFFKCVKCSEISAPLSQVRGNWESTECVICGDAPVFMFDLGCNHPTCSACFEHYITASLQTGQFTFRPPFGYTVTCPTLGCEFCVTDVHHFRVLGTTLYTEYQRLATEKLIALDDTGLFCPFPNCGASFFWEDEESTVTASSSDSNRVQCPECLRLFCKNCREGTCICGQLDSTAVTIQATTKKCPGCGVNTERNGGCAHMTCVHCSLHWCWICLTEWKEDCQWDHWFA